MVLGTPDVGQRADIGKKEKQKEEITHIRKQESARIWSYNPCFIRGKEKNNIT